MLKWCCVFPTCAHVRMHVGEHSPRSSLLLLHIVHNVYILIYVYVDVLYVLCMYVNTYVCTYLMFLQITYAALQFSEEAGGNGKNDIHCKEELGNVQYSEVECLQV